MTRCGRDSRDKVFRWAVRSESSAAVTAMIRLARGVDGILTRHEDLDADPSLLNVANGTIDLRTSRPRPHDPADLMTVQVPVAFDPDAPAPLWEACLLRWQPDPALRDTCNEKPAPAPPNETLSVHHGSGGNGKSKFWGAAQYVLGDYATVPHKSLLVNTRADRPAWARQARNWRTA